MAEHRRRWPRRVRRMVQGAAFVLFLAYVAGAATLAEKGFAADWLMRFSPLSGLGASLSAWTLLWAFLPAALVLIASILLGRCFCGWLCPLGTTIDLGDKVIGLLRGNGEQRGKGGSTDEGAALRPSPERRLKYYVLTVCLVAALLGLSLFAYLDPLSIAVRSYALVVLPYVTRAYEPATQGFQLHVVLGLVLALVLALGFIGRRYWCRAICPLGALYALAGKWSLTARKVSDACVHCRRCVGVCPTDCISPDGVRTLAGECILCLNCQAVCPVDAIRFLGPGRGQGAEVDLTRRGALTAVGAAVVSYPLFKLTPSARLGKGVTFIRPPLAGRDEAGFLERCLRCGQCMSVCPTQVIQSAGLAGGLESLWTPVLVPRMGYCTYDCERCGRACPSGAIPRFSLEQKHSTAVGLAYVDRVRCIPWRGWQRKGEQGVDWDAHNCGVCEEVCPVPGKAIHFRRESMPGGQELRLPYVREEACVGCGSCENSCPVRGRAAIRVTGGFRELPRAAGSEMRASGAEAPPPAVILALPLMADGMRIQGDKELYEGRQLWDKIDGGADPYHAFNFVRLGVAVYSAGAARLDMRLWEFKTPEDAFGAYARDRAASARPAELGDEGALAEGPSLWARRGRYMISILSLGAATATKDQALGLARAALGALRAKGAPRPALCRRLPERGLDLGSVRFLRSPLHLFDLGLPDGMEDSVALHGTAQAAYGSYGAGANGRRIGLLLVEYGSAAGARAALGRYLKVRADAGDRLSEKRDVTLLDGRETGFSAVAAVGAFFAAAVFVPDAGRATELIRAAVRSE